MPYRANASGAAAPSRFGLDQHARTLHHRAVHALGHPLRFHHRAREERRGWNETAKPIPAVSAISAVKPRRSRRKLRVVQHAGALVAMCLPAVALWSVAQAQTEQVSLAYSAPAQCPDESAFMTQMSNRTSRVRFTRESSAARTFRVQVVASGDRYSAVLEVLDPSGTRSVRRFDDPSCAEVVSAISLVAALAVDPAARTTLPVASSAVSASAPAATAPSIIPERVPPPAASHQPTGAAYRMGAGALIASSWGPAPGALITLGPTFEIAQSTDRVLALSARVTPLFGRTGLIGPETSEAAFRYLGARLEGCPFRLNLVHGLDAHACMVVDLAALTASGRNVPNPRSATRGWYAMGLGADVSWGRESAWFVQVGGALLAPLVRDRFVVVPDQDVVHEPPRVGGSVQLAGGVHFL